MSRFVRALLGGAVVALMLAAGASSRASGDVSIPPMLLSPSQGQSFSGGTPIVFQIQTFPGDSLLSLRVSRSQATDSCGKIGNDVTSKSFSSTSDPSVYQAAPNYYAGNWMDTPGTYYWQAYRTSGADGCIESEVRSFTITPGPSLTPPTLLSPAPAQSITPGTQLSFRISTFAGDKSLRLRVSHSQARDSCGRISSDVESEDFGASSDPAIVEAAPTHYKGGWMDTPGTYYWQAYRAVYGAGADGCIESEVRTLKIEYPPPKSLAAARLDGKFNIEAKVGRSSGITNFKRGQTFVEQWAFTPGCATGSCRTLAGASYSRLGRWMLVLKRSGAIYKRSVKAPIARCLTKTYSGSFKVNLHVTKGIWVGTEWRAARFTGTVRASFKARRNGAYICHAGKFLANVRGSLAE